MHNDDDGTAPSKHFFTSINPRTHMNHGNRETERTVTMRITVPVYGMVEHVNKLVDRVQRILSLSFADIKVEQVEIEIDDPDQLTFDHG